MKNAIGHLIYSNSYLICTYLQTDCEKTNTNFIPILQVTETWKIALLVLSPIETRKHKSKDLNSDSLFESQSPNRFARLARVWGRDSRTESKLQSQAHLTTAPFTLFCHTGPSHTEGKHGDTHLTAGRLRSERAGVWTSSQKSFTYVLRYSSTII